MYAKRVEVGGRCSRWNGKGDQGVRWGRSRKTKTTTIKQSACAYTKAYYTHTHVYVRYTHTQAYIHAHTNICIYTHMCVRTHTNTQSFARAHKYIYRQLLSFDKVLFFISFFTAGTKEINLFFSLLLYFLDRNNMSIISHQPSKILRCRVCC